MDAKIVKVFKANYVYVKVNNSLEDRLTGLRFGGHHHYESLLIVISLRDSKKFASKLTCSIKKMLR